MPEPDDKPTPEIFELTKLLLQAQALRTDRLPWIKGALSAFIKELETAGCDCQEGFDLIVEGLKKLKDAIPRYICRLCEVRGKKVSNCLCNGKGWYREDQMPQFIATSNRAKLLDSGDKRSIGKIIRDLGKHLPPDGEADDAA